MKKNQTKQTQTNKEGPTIVDDNEVLTIEDAAKYLKVSVVWLYKMTSERKIPFTRIGRMIRFRKKELDAWLTSRVVKPSRHA